MALGHVPGLRVAEHRPRDVAENGEFSAPPARHEWVLCHTTRKNAGRIGAWLQGAAGQQPAIPGGSMAEKPSPSASAQPARSRAQHQPSDFPDRIFAIASPQSAA